MQLFTDWPITYLIWLSFCATIWLMVGIVMTVESIDRLKRTIRHTKESGNA